MGAQRCACTWYQWAEHTTPLSWMLTVVGAEAWGSEMGVLDAVTVNIRLQCWQLHITALWASFSGKSRRGPWTQRAWATFWGTIDPLNFGPSTPLWKQGEEWDLTHKHSTCGTWSASFLSPLRRQVLCHLTSPWHFPHAQGAWFQCCHTEPSGESIAQEWIIHQRQKLLAQPLRGGTGAGNAPSSV